MIAQEFTQLLDSKVTPSNSTSIAGLEKIGTVKDLLIYLEVIKGSYPRENKNGNPYFMLWTKKGGTFYLPLSKSLRKFEFNSITELVDYPVYKAECEDADGNPITTISIGVEQRTDVEDLNFAPVVAQPKTTPRPASTRK